MVAESDCIADGWFHHHQPPPLTALVGSLVFVFTLTHPFPPNRPTILHINVNDVAIRKHIFLSKGDEGGGRSRRLCVYVYTRTHILTNHKATF
jgi:hypothetical protein